MKMDYKQWTVFCLVNVCLYATGASALTTSRVVHVYGAQQGVQIKTDKPSGVSYVLDLAAFKHKQYAVDYRKKIASRTDEPVQLVYNPNSHIPYQIFIGPIVDIKTVQRVSRQALSETGQHPHQKSGHVEQQTINKNTVLRHSKAEISNEKPPLHLTKVVTVSVGPAWSSANKTQTFFLQPDIEKTYASTNGSSSLISGEIFFGLQRPLHSMLDGQLGLAVAGASNVNLSGDVWEDANPDFNNYVYKYNVNHGHVAVKGKLLSHFNSIYHPYISGSVGVGFNHAYAFGLTPKIVEEIPAPLFQANTTSAFTYTLGLGISKEINANWQVGVGYEFSDWGKSHLAAAPGQTIGYGLALTHLYTNELQLSITFLPAD